MPNLFSRLLSRGADKQLKEFEQITAQVNDLEPKFQAMSDDELRGQTQIFRDRYAAGESLDGATFVLYADEEQKQEVET